MPRMTIATPLGPMLAVEEEGFLTALDFVKDNDISEHQDDSPLLLRVKEELTQYFAGQRREFSIPLKPRGTAFQQAVWAQLQVIPYGQTRSYADVAQTIGKPKAVRAVGGANHNNPISILIPCHRVIGKSGQLTGYGGGLERKEALLSLERKP